MYNSVLDNFDVPERVIKTRKEWAASDAIRDEKLSEAKDVDKYLDISYGPYEKWNLLDLYKPSKDNAGFREGKIPVIINIHGGGYFYGDKGLYRIYCMEFAHRGYAVINFNYRLAPENHFPCTIEDITAVCMWMVNNSEEYGLDLDRVFMMGDSAGAQLVSQYGAIWSNPDYARLYGIDIKDRFNLRAVSMACGMYDIISRAQSLLNVELMEDYLGKDFDLSDPKVDVLSFITSDFPDAYLFTAHNDFLKTECEPMYKLLKEAGVGCEWDMYGSPEAKEVSHVFHINIAHSEAVKANDRQDKFFKDRC